MLRPPIAHRRGALRPSAQNAGTLLIVLLTVTREYVFQPKYSKELVDVLLLRTSSGRAERVRAALQAAVEHVRGDVGIILRSGESEPCAVVGKVVDAHSLGSRSCGWWRS